MDAGRREAAADWLQRLSKKQVAESDVDAWLEWYGESDANRQAFDSMQTLYMRLRRVSTQQRDTLRDLMPAQRFSSRHWLGGRRVFGLALVASLAIVAVGVGLWYGVERELRPIAYAAPIDHYRTVVLPDGSAMVLGARAVANVSYTSTARGLEVLQGGAYFEVKRDARRPFVVQAGEVSITAVGTAFSVTREATTLGVTVTEGVVDVTRSPAGEPVTRPAERTRVKAGERALLPVRAASPRAQTPRLTPNPWNNGAMTFFNAPLVEVIQAVNAQGGSRILIEDPRVSDLNYSGTVFRERIDEWVAALPLIYPVRAVPLQDGTITLVLRPDE
jgi:transmembrane sensor